MLRTSILPTALLLLLLGACGVAPGDDLPPTDDDDDATPDDGTPRLTFEPTVVAAGELGVVFTTLHNFTLGEGAMACCADDDVRFYQTAEAINDTMYDFLFYFGLRGDGPAEWGIESDGEQAIGEFLIEPLGDVPELGVGLGAGTASLPEPGAFDVLTFEVPEPNSLVSIRASGGPEDMHPWLWVFEDDGMTGVINAGFETANGFQTPAVGFWAAEAGSYFLRIDENDDEAGGEDWRCDLDLQITPGGDPMGHDEIEPNDTDDAWQELGVFAPGLHRVTGVAATAGHDADNDLSGDLDVFWFELEGAAFVEFELNWDDASDLDALLYRGTPATVDLGFGSGQAVSYAMASTEQPEATRISLTAGSYVVEVGNWEGSPEVPWTIDLRIVPMDFAPEER